MLDGLISPNKSKVPLVLSQRLIEDAPRQLYLFGDGHIGNGDNYCNFPKDFDILHKQVYSDLSQILENMELNISSYNFLSSITSNDIENYNPHSIFYALLFHSSAGELDIVYEKDQNLTRHFRYQIKKGLVVILRGTSFPLGIKTRFVPECQIVSEVPVTYSKIDVNLIEE